MFRNVIPVKRDLNIKTDIKYGLERYSIITSMLESGNYETRVVRMKFYFIFPSKKKNRFEHMIYISYSEREAKRNHYKIKDAFEKGRKYIKRIANGNVID